MKLTASAILALWSAPSVTVTAKPLPAGNTRFTVAVAVWVFREFCTWTVKL